MAKKTVDPKIESLLQRIKGDPSLVDRLLMVAEPTAVDTIQDVADAFRAVTPLLAGRESEHLVVIALNRRHAILGVKVLTVGNDAHTIVDPKQVFRFALTCGKTPAQAVILAHNHPSGDPTPSMADVEVTNRAVNAGVIVGIEVLDHLVVAGDMYRSLREEGLIAPKPSISTITA